MYATYFLALVIGFVFPGQLWRQKFVGAPHSNSFRTGIHGYRIMLVGYESKEQNLPLGVHCPVIIFNGEHYYTRTPKRSTPS